MTKPTSPTANVDRRRFLQASAAGAALSLSSVPFVHAQGNDVLRVGLVGCGRRGSGAAKQALLADPNVRLVAMGDAFRDQLDDSLTRLRRDNTIAQKIDVPRERQFVGFDAYQQVINACDVVLLCTPPHFRPMHIRAAVQARKHMFVEKPVAVDVPGAKSVLEACTEARRHRLSIVSGLCFRYDLAKRATMARIHDGAIGDIVAIHTNYLARGLWNKARDQAWSDMEFQMRNWLYYTWLSGDHIVEQHIHSLDKVAWALKDTYPIKAVGLGGRQVRTGPEYGHIFDHHAVIFEYASGVKCFSFTRQQVGCDTDVNDYILGTQGKCSMMAHRITGRNEWSYSAAQVRRDPDMYQSEHNDLFRSIRRGEPINNGEYMTKSTLMAIMGRMATYTGMEITWDRLMESRENLSPARYEWGNLPTPEVAKPGVTRFS